MKNKRKKKSVERLDSLLSKRQGSNPFKMADDKTVLADECGDSLWDGVLNQDERKLPGESSQENTEAVNGQGKVKD